LQNPAPNISITSFHPHRRNKGEKGYRFSELFFTIYILCRPVTGAALYG
jgi:hypothetical protein